MLQNSTKFYLNFIFWKFDYELGFDFYVKVVGPYPYSSYLSLCLTEDSKTGRNWRRDHWYMGLIRDMSMEVR